LRKYCDFLKSTAAILDFGNRKNPMGTGSVGPIKFHDFENPKWRQQPS